MNIIEAIRDPRFFRPLFKDLGTWRAWFVLLKSIFGLPLEGPEEEQLYAACTGNDGPPEGRAREAYIIAGRRSGKSFMASAIAVYLATFRDWSPYLSPGEKGWIFIIATDRDQAKIIKRYISAILDSNPIFRNMVAKNLEWGIELKNNISIAVKTCNFRAIRGFTVVAAICEELAFWKDENSANPAQEVLAALRPALATIPESVLIAISTPYSRSGVLWEQFKAHFGKGTGTGPLVWKAPTRIMNPTISAATIENDMIEDPCRARAEWEAEWRDDIEAFLGMEVIEAAVVPGRFELPRLKDMEYLGFIDPSGGRGDSFTLAVCHKEEGGKIVLDCIREALPPFQPQNVVSELGEVLEDYGVSYVESDRYSAEWVISEFTKHGIVVRNSELTSSELFLNFLPLIMNGSVDLLENPRLVDQLRGLERRKRAGGKDLISHGSFSGAHDDVAVAVAGACLLASRSDADFLALQGQALAPVDIPIEDISPSEDLEWRSQQWLLTGKLPPPADVRAKKRQNPSSEESDPSGTEGGSTSPKGTEAKNSVVISRWKPAR